MKINNEIKRKIIEYIKDITGCESLFLLVTDRELPCKEDIENGNCNGHDSASFVERIGEGHLLGLLAEEIKERKARFTHEHSGLKSINLKDLK